MGMNCWGRRGGLGCIREERQKKRRRMGEVEEGEEGVDAEEE